MQRCSRSRGQPNGSSTRAAGRAPWVTYGSPYREQAEVMQPAGAQQLTIECPVAGKPLADR
jgi:hypothetical protein